MKDGSIKNAGLQTEGRGSGGENVVTSDYIILLPLSALKPDPIIDYQEGTVQSTAEAEVGSRFIGGQS